MFTSASHSNFRGKNATFGDGQIFVSAPPAVDSPSPVAPGRPGENEFHCARYDVFVLSVFCIHIFYVIYICIYILCTCIYTYIYTYYIHTTYVYNIYIYTLNSVRLCNPVQWKEPTRSTE